VLTLACEQKDGATHSQPNTFNGSVHPDNSNIDLDHTGQ